MAPDSRKIQVLMCDDDPADRALVRQLLKMVPSPQFELLEVEDGCGLVEALISGKVDAVLLDVQLPGRSGLEWLRELKSLGIAPVIMATGHGDEMVAVEAMKSGAYDYLPKVQFSANSLSRTIINVMERWTLEGQVKAYRKELEAMAMTDPLTGILNRRSLMDAMRSLVEEFLRSGTPLSLIMLDVDHFKGVNDTYGHDVGDLVLTGVCRAVEKAIGNGPVFGRYGGEELMVVLSGSGIDEAVGVAEGCRLAVAGQSMVDRPGLDLKVTVSLGVAAGGMDTKSHEDLIKKADIALYSAKEGGRNMVKAS